MPLNPVSPAGMIHAINDNFDELAGITSGADGLGGLRVARFTFDAGVVGNRTVDPHGTGVTIPLHAIVCGGFVVVNTAFTSADTNTGTIAISVQAANDIISAAAVSGAPYSTICHFDHNSHSLRGGNAFDII